MEDEVFDSVMWDTPSSGGGYEISGDDAEPSAGPGYRQEPAQTSKDEPKWEGYLEVEVKDPVKELEHTKDAYISYLVVGRTDLLTFTSRSPQARRRFQDFVFLQENLTRDFPACVVPPLPGKHPMQYITGDRFSPEFVEHRRSGLQRFLQRLARHPTLQRSSLIQKFFESSEWTVTMHKHLAHPPGPEPPQSLFDNISDTVMNAFTRVRKPDERFMDVRDNIDRFEEGLTSIDRLYSRSRARTNDLSNDYRDLALSVQGLGFLESGITDPLNQFSNTLLEFSSLLKSNTTETTDEFLQRIHSLLLYSQCHKNVLKLRDQKQLDLEVLTMQLSNAVIERDRLASFTAGRPGATSYGIGSYLKDRVDSFRGGDTDQARYERMRKLDVKIKSFQSEVTSASDTSEAFSDETLKEYAVFQHAKEAEMKEMLASVADGQIEMYKKATQEWDNLIPVLQRIRVDL